MQFLTARPKSGATGRMCEEIQATNPAKWLMFISFPPEKDIYPCDTIVIGREFSGCIRERFVEGQYKYVGVDQWYKPANTNSLTFSQQLQIPWNMITHVISRESPDEFRSHVNKYYFHFQMYPLSVKEMIFEPPLSKVIKN